MNMETRREEAMFVIIHSWQMIINSDRVVYNQSKEFSIPRDKLSRGTSQGEWSCRMEDLEAKHPYTFLVFIS